MSHWATVIGLCILAPSILDAQYPRGRRGHFEVSGLDFRQDGAWRKRVSAIRTARHRLLQNGALAALNLAAPTAAGAHRVAGRVIIPVVPIAYSNVAPPFPSSRYHDLFFNPAPSDRPYSLRSFYEEVSNGNISIDGRVFGWVVADSSDVYYEDGCHGIGVLTPCPQRPFSRFGQLLLAALDAVSGQAGAGVWNDFDNDGPDGVPNSGDDDGFVDFVTFLQPERDGACPNSPNIWAHRFVIRAWNGGSPYVTRTPWTGHAGQFLKIDDYIIQSAVGGSTACDPASLMPIGTVAHETGHAFGLPDLYDTDLSNPKVTQGIGEWGLMGSGNYSRPYSPSRFEAWSLLELGWVRVDTLSSGRLVHLAPVASSDTILYLPVPGTDEYYLFENRQPQESDTAQMNPAFGHRQKSPGLLVWHVDRGQVETHGFDRDNRVNVGPVHGLALIQADGRDDLRKPGGDNRGDTGDPFPGTGTNESLCRSTRPAASDNHGRFAWFCLDSIIQTSPGGPVGFRYIAYRSVFGSDQAEAGAVIKVNGSAVARLEQFIPPGTSTEVSVDSIQTDEAARTRFDFLNWSDGGPRTHQVAAGDTPDTVTARLAVSHRLRVAVGGATTSAVNSGITGDVAAGVYLAEHSQVTLQAAPQVDAVFAGWSGDTTSTQDTLRLSMHRPFDLMANFVSVQRVEVVGAAQALLGSGTLSPEAATYLDATGNRNGVYDLGDFLAASDRATTALE